MTERNAVRAAVHRALEMLNAMLDEAAQVPIDDATALTGLDSLAVTNLLVAVEEAVRETLGVEISMTEERTLDLVLSEDATPLRTVATLIDHVAGLVEEAAA